MNQLGKNLVFSLCIVATVLVVIGLKRKFGSDADRTLLSQQSESTEFDAANSVAPQPRVVQAHPQTQHDRTVISPTSSRYGEQSPATSPAGAFPISPIEASVPIPQEPKPSEVVAVNKPVDSSISTNIGDEEPQEMSMNEPPSIPVSTHPEFVMTTSEDSFWSISEQIYGSGVYYRALFRHNQANVLRPDQLRAGIEVKTPTLDALRKLYPDDCPTAP